MPGWAEVNERVAGGRVTPSRVLLLEVGEQVELRENGLDLISDTLRRRRMSTQSLPSAAAKYINIHLNRSMHKRCRIDK